MKEFNDTCQHYISLLQDNINRMASNSSNCKTWLITLIAAIFAISASKGDIVTYIWMAYIPTALFFFLDCFYLGAECRFRRIERRFVALVIQDEEALKNECLPHDIDISSLYLKLTKTSIISFARLSERCGRGQPLLFMFVWQQ